MADSDDSPSGLRQRIPTAHNDSSSPPPVASGGDQHPRVGDAAVAEDVVKPKTPRPSANGLARAEDQSSIGSIALDVARLLVFLLLLSGSLSYLVTRESLVWNIKRPRWTNLEHVKSYFTAPLLLTPAQLLLHNGSDASRPLLLGINGSIYDVSAGRRFYGPGGSYAFFAGRDGSRAFVTSCFDTDVHSDMRGVEVMYLPLEEDEAAGQSEGGRVAQGGGPGDGGAQDGQQQGGGSRGGYTRGELKVLRERERRQAKREVDKALGHWIGVFEAKYPRVGRLVGVELDEEPPALCEKARKMRKPRPRKGETPGKGTTGKALGHT